jgi:HD-like signal output (HDOD) protein
MCVMADFRDQLEKKLRIVEDLPTFPSVVFELERVMASDSSGAAEVALIIEEDPSLTANVLKLANSAAYYSSVSGTIVSVKDAVARLGFREIRQVVTTVELIRTFKDFGNLLKHQDFWRHSLRTAVSARGLGGASPRIDPIEQDEVYVGGLLHNVNLLLLDQYFPEVLNEVLTRVRQQGSSTAAVEQELLGMDHGEIGGELLKLWDIPESVVATVVGHLQPDQTADDIQHMVQIVNLAEILATNIKAAEVLLEGPNSELIELGADEPEQEVEPADEFDFAQGMPEPVLAALGLNAAEITRIVKDVKIESIPFISSLV